MSTEENKAVFRRMVDEIFNEGKMDMFDELIAADFIEHEELPPGTPSGREGVEVLTTQFRNSFPDFKATIEDLIAEGDRVVSRMTWTGTHKGEFMGIPPTGRSISIEVFDIVRIAGGKFAEHWGLMDSMRMMEQLGIATTQGENEG